MALEGPVQCFLDANESFEIKRGNFSWPVIDTDLTVTTFTREGPIGFTLHTPHWSADYQLTIADGRITFTCDGPEPTVTTSRQAQPFSEYLNQHGLRILFEDEAILVGWCRLRCEGRDRGRGLGRRAWRKRNLAI
ncbi:hypothetical protein ADL12_03595 [Streptomyces regalis]|uniref:Uncharacterized protein n=1 Tax=Streptomyces regalis TaxID=68262 RepID=A0A0X3VPD3_9ACTN|nr:hypothetical protein ADL12_03595 [Streptomyces regalis]